MTRRTSRKRTSLRPNFIVTPRDRKVVMAFLDQRAAESKKLWTDGKRLDGLWMGGRGIAEWIGDEIVFSGYFDKHGKWHHSDPSDCAAQTVQRLVRKEAPAAWLKPNARRRTSRSRNVRRSSRKVRRASLRRNAATVLITGNTYPVKDQIKALGGRWDPDAKGWRVPEANASRARALVGGGGGASRSTTSSSRTTHRRRGARYCEGWGADNPHPPRPPYTCYQCEDD